MLQVSSNAASAPDIQCLRTHQSGVLAALQLKALFRMLHLGRFGHDLCCKEANAIIASNQLKVFVAQSDIHSPLQAHDKFVQHMLVIWWLHTSGCCLSIITVLVCCGPYITLFPVGNCSRVSVCGVDSRGGSQAQIINL